MSESSPPTSKDGCVAAPGVTPRSFDFNLHPELLAQVLVTFSSGDGVDARHVRWRTMIAFWWVLPVSYLATIGALLLFDRLLPNGLDLPDRALYLFSIFPPIIVLLFLASPDRHLDRWKRHATTSARTTAPLSAGRIRLEVREDGIDYADRWGTVRYGWNGVAALWAGPNAVVFSMANHRLLVLPKSVFADAEDLTSFVTEMTAKVRSSGGEDTILRVLLADNDAECPGCRYNLRGAQRRACPECGRVIELNDVPRQIMLYSLHEAKDRTSPADHAAG